MLAAEGTKHNCRQGGKYFAPVRLVEIKMTEMLNAHIRREAAVGFVINALLNGLIIWLLKKDVESIPMGGDQGFGLDIVITAFLLLFCVAAIVIALQRKKAAKGELATFSWDNSKPFQRMLNLLPRSAWLSGLCFGLFGLIVVVPLTLYPMILMGITAFSPISYTIFKGLWAGALAALITPAVIMVALGEDDAVRVSAD